MLEHNLDTVTAPSNRSGVYGIRNKVNGKLYVGSSINLGARWSGHKSQLRKGTHGNTHLQSSWVKYGEAAFEFGLLTLCPVDELDHWEGHFIEVFRTAERERGYNLDTIRSGTHFKSAETRSKMSASRMGWLLDDATKAKISLANTGKTASEETRAKLRAWRSTQVTSEITRLRIGEANRRRVVTEETKAKISESKTGSKLSEETKDKMRIAHTGKVHTEEHKAKVREALTGQKRSEETCRKISEAKKGRPLSEKVKAAIAAGQIGRKHSEETLAKMKESARKRWADKKASDMS